MHNNYVFTEKVLVDADNDFKVNGFEFSIPVNNDKYRVIKKYDEEHDYENESQMDCVLVTLSTDLKFNFYDEEGNTIDGVELKK